MFWTFSTSFFQSQRTNSADGSRVYPVITKEQRQDKNKLFKGFETLLHVRNVDFSSKNNQKKCL